MSKLELKESKKLHYGKYLYKLKLYNQLAGIFRTDLQRSGKLTFAKEKLTEYLSMHKRGDYIYKNTWGRQKPVSPESIIDASEIYNILKSSKERLIRCESNTLIVYSNDRQLLVKLANKTKDAYPELWEPDPNNINFLKNNQNVIIVDKPTLFPYKLSFGRKKGNPDFAKWIKKNLDKVQAGSVLLNNLANEHWIQGQYIYVRDESIILLVQMFVGDNITRIDKMVYKEDLDK